MYKLLYAVLLYLVLFYGAPALSATTVEIYGDDGYAPYSYKKDGKLVGIDTRIIVEANKRIADYDIVLKPIFWKQALSFLENGKIGFLYPPYYRPKLRPYMAYSTELMEEKLVVFCRTEFVEKGLHTFPDDFDGLIIGKKVGFAPGEKVDTAAKNGIVKIVEMNETKDLLDRVLKGIIDCYINDKLSTEYDLKTMQAQGLYNGKSIQESLTLSTEKAYLGVNKHPNKYPYTNDFIKQFNRAINEMKADGTIEKIINE